MELKEVSRVPVTKTVRFVGIKENGEEVYIGRSENFVSIIVLEEVEDKA